MIKSFKKIYIFPDVNNYDLILKLKLRKNKNKIYS